MATELTIEQLKLAREIGATHVDMAVDSGSIKDEFYRKDGSAYVEGQWDEGWAGLSLLDDKNFQYERIDFSPLDDYYADKEVDIAATGGEVDMVNHPPHYQSDNGIECIDAIRAALGKEGFIAYCRGNAMKYTWRDKQNNAEDYLKAVWYLEKAAQEQEK